MNLFIKLVLAISVVGALAFSAPVYAVDTDAALNCGANLQLQTSGCTGTGEDPATSIEDTIQTVINIISIIVGIVAVIMIIIAGFKYITSNGDSGAVSGAKNTIIYAIVGLIIVALAQAIVRFVIGRITIDG